VSRALFGLAVVAATVAAVWTAMPRMASLGARMAVLSESDPTVMLDRAITRDFGFGRPVVWVLEARDGTIWTRPMLQRLAALTDDVRRIAGVVPLDVIGLASPNMRDLRVTEDRFEPTYLMGTVPETPAAIAALRRRIDADPNYAGTLVTHDGRAAMVVANFRADTDPRAIGSAAIALRDRYRDADVAVWAVGGPVLAVAASPALAALAMRAAAFTLAGLLALGAALGLRAAASVLLAVVLAVVWLAIGALLTASALPWTLGAAGPTALLAAAVAAQASKHPGRTAVILAAAGLAGSLLLEPPTRTLWIAVAGGAPLAVLAGRLARMILRPPRRPGPIPALTSAAGAGLALVALLGLPRTDCSFGLLGYGERYLPVAATADLAAMRRLFPPPASLALRARGAPGFLTAPEVLRALDAQTTAARADPAVRHAMSIADVVKMVHRAFNDDRPEFFAIPDDRALVGRYLALAYSPAFRRFLDRAFTETAVWIQVDSERPGDLERVLARLRASLADHPVPDAVVDLPAGDGAVVLVMARMARRIAASALLALAVAAAVAAMIAGPRAGLRALGCGSIGAAVAVGLLGCAGHTIDLAAVPLLGATAAATAAIAGAGHVPAHLGLGLAGAGVVALVAALPGHALVAALLLGPGLALVVWRPIRAGRPVDAHACLPLTSAGPGM
jgi:hypothetical protein